MRISEIRAVARILDWIDEQEFVAWVPEDGTDVVYGQLLPLNNVTDEPNELQRLRVRIETNRGYTLTFPLGTAIDKLLNETFWCYDWRETKPTRIG